MNAQRKGRKRHYKQRGLIDHVTQMISTQMIYLQDIEKKEYSCEECS